MKHQLQATVRWQQTAWQIIVSALLLLMACGLAKAQNTQELDQKLLTAVKSGQVSEVKALLKMGANPNAAGELRGELRWTALMYTAAAGDMPCAQALLEAGAEVNMENLEGATALLIAVGRRRSDMVPMLLDKGANPNVMTKKGITALMVAAMSTKETAKLVRALLEKGADPNVKSLSGLTALGYAALTGDADAVRALLDKGADPNSKGADGKTALMIAKEKGFTEIATLLERAGANPLTPAEAPLLQDRQTAGANALNVAVQSQRNPPCPRDRKPGNVITHLEGTASRLGSEEEDRMIMECMKASNQASEKCKELLRKQGFGAAQTFVIGADCEPISLGTNPPPEKVQEVIKQVLLRVWLQKVRAALAEGQDVNTPDEDGHSLLTGACAGGDFALVKELLSRGARVNPSNSPGGLTPLLAAIASGSTEITRYLLGKGADPNLDKSKQEKTPLHLAVDKELLEPVKLLIAAGADVNAKTAKEEITPLHVAVVSDNLPIAQELIRAKANLNETDAKGFTPLLYTILLKKVTMVRTLITAGADVNTRHQTGLTPLAVALNVGNQEIIDLLRSAGAK